ncbi:MAG: alpha-hydroxy-acid oxidizing protein [Spirochaetes bacterium]|jgi:isopentenyl diphosphate isomerase/L-lactate dehydrogenase-like FMN-dependent dehydrogenase/biotin carboxylase|nr:alpha-hydroxy-acid oxidizing protein [Spirochaetota bacterium]
MKKSILVIGGGLLQLPLIKKGKEMGLLVIVTDYNPDVLGLQYADIPLVMSTRDVEGSVRIAKRQHELTPISGVVTCGTDASMTVAAVANALGLPGIKFEDAEAATNKIKMRTRFKNQGVPSPDFCSVWSLIEAKTACKKLGLPLVIKPSDNMGARGVRFIDDMNDISDAFHAAKNASPSGELIMEKYMIGPELSIDAVVFDGEVTFTGIADRIIEDLPYFIEKGHTMPSHLDPDVIEEARRVMKLGIKALGINHGFAKGDIKVTPDGVKIGELAARLSGGFMSTHTFPYATGVDLMKAAIEISLGQEPGNLEPVLNKVSIERAIITEPGIIKSIDNLVEAGAIKGVNDIVLNVSPGDRVVKPRSNVEKAGHIIATADTLEEAEAIVQKARNTLTIKIAAENEVSIEIIRARAREKFGKICLCCKDCNGEQCTSSIPGMGAVGTGESFRRNIRSLSEYKIVTRLIHDVHDPDMSITLYGKKMQMPVLVSPITGTVTNMNGAIEELQYNRAVVGGARRSGVLAMVGDGASPEKYRVGLQAIREAEGGIPIFKPRKEISQLTNRIREAEEAGAVAIGMDIDAIVLKTMTLRDQTTTARGVENLSQVISLTKLPFILKGIMSVRDAEDAVAAEADTIIVSNHGGRVLDQMPGVMDVLPEICRAVKGKITIIADGGFRSGVDVFKALAFGADAVSIGRPVCVAAVGMEEYGVEFYLNQVKEELRKCMILSGCQTTGDINENSIMKLKV